ncbi:MAG: ketose-bisphosphate aldolase [Beutenbergiaceae bacterium]
MIQTSRELFATATGAVAAFNVITVEHAEAIAAAAESAGTPVIMQLSQNAIRFHHGPRAIAAAMVAVAQTCDQPVVLHLDHITEPELARQASSLGFSSVMFDGAEHDYDTNVALTREIATWGTGHDVWVEAELGKVGGKDGAHTPGVRTDPVEAAQFAADTSVDALAVAVGSSHAMTQRSAGLDIPLIQTIAGVVDIPLVLHGSSGVPDEGLVAAARAGMRKINIGTALNVAFTSAVRDWLTANEGVDPRKYITQARTAMTECCTHYLRLLHDAV